MQLSRDADLTFEQFNRCTDLERLRLPEIHSMVIDRSGGVTLPDAHLMDRQLFDV
jgi:hypothetical protein